MGYLTIHRVCNGAHCGPQPARATLCGMFDALTRELAQLGHRPLRLLKTESWPIGGGKMLARLRIECEAGEPTRPFASWYQWQHPQWDWSLAMLPTVDCTAVERAHVAPPLAIVPPASAVEARP